MATGDLESSWGTFYIASSEPQLRSIKPESSEEHLSLPGEISQISGRDQFNNLDCPQLLSQIKMSSPSHARI